MEMTFKDALAHALKETKRSLRSVCVRAGVSYDQMKSLMQGKSNSTNIDDGIKIAAAFGVSVEDFFAGVFDRHPSVAVAGKVGAGARVDLVDAFEKGDGMYHVARPPQLRPNGVVAVEVEGDSMMPLYRPGSVLFYTRATADGVPVEAINAPCVCEDADGRAWLKVVKVGSQEGTFSLLSLNPDADNMHGVRLKWAAPVLLALSPEFVERAG
ncbi:phage repressor protein [Cereibacter azotoformans]|uniref:XRE family transcriptional regulator n=1 Tax=Cereibacter azotoformans TaxID=43057 RepID=UPI001EEB8D95|nr:XRE family transcriptional regulator [Cereibacter azotoformans]ULB10714.1 phage repressor protein [Cereibacter azotoformans]